MLKLIVEKGVLESLGKLERKHAGQVSFRILALMSNPSAPDVSALRGQYARLKRADIGEYRIIFQVEGDELRVVLVGRRNDAEVYRTLGRMR